MDQPLVRASVQGSAGHLTLARAEKKNALTKPMLRELGRGLEEHIKNPAVKLVVLDAEGRDFCAGLDLAELLETVDSTPGELLRDAQILANLFARLRSSPKPTVSVVQGRALAGGCGLAIACDVTLAHPGAHFGFPEIQRAFVPAMVSAMLARSLGEKQAFFLLATGVTISAADAASCGLITRVLRDADGERAHDYLGALAQADPVAMSLTKDALRAQDGAPFVDGLERTVHLSVQARKNPALQENLLRWLEDK